MEEVKNSTRQKLLELAGKYGNNVAIEAARKALSLRAENGDFKKNFNGEICETVLELILQEEIKKHKNWFYMKGIVLPDVGGRTASFLTEIDFVVCVPQCVFCIECKSYAGNGKRLTGRGTITYKNKERDVYAQNKMHMNVLHKFLDPFASCPVYQMLLFNFSNGSIKDERSAEARREFPLVDERNVISILQAVSRGESVWDMVGLARAREKLERFSDENRERHLEYVKTMHREGT